MHKIRREKERALSALENNSEDTLSEGEEYIVPAAVSFSEEEETLFRTVVRRLKEAGEIEDTEIYAAIKSRFNPNAKQKGIITRAGGIYTELVKDKDSQLAKNNVSAAVFFLKLEKHLMPK